MHKTGSHWPPVSFRTFSISPSRLTPCHPLQQGGRKEVPCVKGGFGFSVIIVLIIIGTEYKPATDRLPRSRCIIPLSLPRNDRTERFSGIIQPRLITGRLPSLSLRADEIGVAIRVFPVSDAVPSYSVVFLFGTRKAPLLKGAVSEAD